MGHVYTDREKCRGGYACIRSCPVKAIRVREGLAEVVEERCIDCGACFQVCESHAQQFDGDTNVVWKLLEQYPSVIAVLSSSFAAGFPEVRPGQLVTAIKDMGFDEVFEDSFGNDLVSQKYVKLLKKRDNKAILSSNCCVVVSYIERYRPQLIGNLAPIVSPMIATGRLIKQHHNPEAKVVYISPCVSKKMGSRDEKVYGAIDAALSFTELKEMFAEKGIVPESVADSLISDPKSNIGRLLAISESPPRTTKLPDDTNIGDTINTSRRDYMTNVLREFETGNITAKFVNLCFHEGCTDGLRVDNDLSVERQKEILTKYANSEADLLQIERDLQEYASIDLSRQFTNRNIKLPAPREEDIQTVLNRIGKVDHIQQLNCGACGYRTCRDMAIGVCQGLAEPTMCWPNVVEELKDNQEALIQAEKLSSLGQMAASVAHEVNNPLSGVLIYTRLLTKKIKNNTFSEQEALGYLAKMDSEIERSSRIIKNLLDFSRQFEPSFRTVDVNEVIEKALSLVGHQAEINNIEVIEYRNPSLPMVTADFDQLRQVLINLTLNAIQAMPDGGKLTLRTSLEDDQIRIDVADTGCGISEENMHKLFTPFFTTKEKGQGVGLGLAVIHGIIQRHKGRIEVESEVGKGTIFTIYLGVQDEEGS
ncbi:MAG: 4Fe-4S binding protein [Chloroflexi bacterium]|nr:4Fe-4S binding protein [Chloroflexota bacterium]